VYKEHKNFDFAITVISINVQGKIRGRGKT
jgi:hypothetical protein